MSVNNPKAIPDGKPAGKEMVEKPPPRTYLELKQPYDPHRSFLDPIKSAFSCPVRPAFTPGRQNAPSVSTSTISTLPSSITPSSMGSPQPVITKAVVRPVISESQTVQTVVSTSVHHTSPLPANTPMTSAPMASIIRGPTQVQPASSHLAHPAVQATYSSHVPRGAAAVASITTLKSSVASPMARAPHVYAPSMISTQSIQKMPSVSYHINSTGLQTRAPSLANLRATVPTIPKTASSLSASEVSRSIPSSSSNLMSSTQLISISRASDSLPRTTLIHSTTNLSKPHSYAHVPQAPEKGFYRPTATPATVMTVQPTLSTATIATKSSISHHSSHLQSLPSSIHLTSYTPISAHPSSISSPLPPPAPVSTATSSLSQSSLQHHTPFPKVIAQAIHTVAPIPLLQQSNIMSPAPTKPVTSLAAVAVTTQSVPRPVVSTGNTSTASIPVAKVYPQPLAITSRPSTESSQHQDIARSAPTATLYVSAPQRMSAVVTTAASTSVPLLASGTNPSFTSSNTVSTEARLERPVVPTPAAYQFPTAMTCFYDSLHNISSTLTMHPISGTSTPRPLTAMPVPTLRAGLSHQNASVTLHSASSRPNAGKINPMIVAMSPTRHPLTATNTYSKSSENLPAPPATTTAAAASHSATLSYSSSPVQAANPPTNPPSSPRPSILRKRTVDGTNVTVRKNLLAAMASSQPVSPRQDPGGSGSTTTMQHTISPLKSTNNLREATHENGQSSESTDSSCNGVPPLSIIIKQEPVDTSEPSVVVPTSFLGANRLLSAPMEASPRKKPRKQQLTGNELVETHSTEEDEEFEKEARDIVKKESLKEGNIKVEEDTGRWIAKRRRSTVTLLHGYQHSWKSRHNHFMRYTDIRTRDERRPTATELSNQKCIIQKANGWKVYHICSQIDDLVELESTVHSRLASLLEAMEKKTGTKEDEDLDLSRANELMRGNIQRCKLIRDQMNDARHQVLKVMDHKARVVEIVGKFVSKLGGKRK